MTKFTAILATIFLANSLLLGYLATQSVQTAPTSLLDRVIVEEAPPADEDMPAMTDGTAPADSDLPSLPAE